MLRLVLALLVALACFGPAEARAADVLQPRAHGTFRLATVPATETRARVLMYHSIGWTAPRPAVSPRALREQITWMQEHDVEIVRMSELLDFLEGKLLLPARVAVVTIDDGERNGYTVAYPIFRELSVPFTLGIPTDAVEHWRSHGAMKWDEIKEMVDSGLCEIASHGHTHKALTGMSLGNARKEIELSRELIAQHTGFRPEALFYPLGASGPMLRKLVQEMGLRAAFVAWGAPVRTTTRRFGLPRYSVDKGTGVHVLSRFFRHGD